MLVKPEVVDRREEGIYADFSDRIARAREAGPEILGVGVCREASLLVTLDKQRVVEHLQAVDGVVDVEQLVVGDPLFYSLIQLAVKRFS